MKVYPPTSQLCQFSILINHVWKNICKQHKKVNSPLIQSKTPQILCIKYFWCGGKYNQTRLILEYFPSIISRNHKNVPSRKTGNEENIKCNFQYETEEDFWTYTPWHKCWTIGSGLFHWFDLTCYLVAMNFLLCFSNFFENVFLF